MHNLLGLFPALRILNRRTVRRIFPVLCVVVKNKDDGKPIPFRIVPKPIDQPSPIRINTGSRPPFQLCRFAGIEDDPQNSRRRNCHCCKILTLPASSAVLGFLRSQSDPQPSPPCHSPRKICPHATRIAIIMTANRLNASVFLFNSDCTAC